MYSIIVMLILMIGLVSTAGYAILNMTNAVQTLNDIEDNRIRMTRITDLIKLNARVDNGSQQLRVPKGAAGTSYNTIPTFLNVPNRTPWGDEYLYCPYATVTGGATNIIDGDAGTYNVRVVNDNSTENRDYVDQSDAPATTDAIVYVIAPKKTKAANPRCADVTFDGTSYSVSNGFVQVITNDDLRVSAGDAFSETGDFYITTTGTGSGYEATDPSSLSQAFATIANVDNRDLRIHLAAGTYAMGAATLDLAATSNAEERSVYFIGADRTTTIINGANDIDIPNTNFVFKDVTVNTRIKLKDSNTTLSDASVQGIEAYNSEVKVENGELLITGNGNTIPLDLYNSSFRMNVGDATISCRQTASLDVRPCIFLKDSEFKAYNSTIDITNFNSNSSFTNEFDGFRLDGSTVGLNTVTMTYTNDSNNKTDSVFEVNSGSDLSINNSTITIDIPLKAIEVSGGRVSVDGSTIDFLRVGRSLAGNGGEYAFYMVNGGQLNLKDSFVGGTSGGEFTHYGIYEGNQNGANDLGASLIISENTVIRSARDGGADPHVNCFVGEVFQCSDTEFLTVDANGADCQVNNSDFEVSIDYRDRYGVFSYQTGTVQDADEDIDIKMKGVEIRTKAALFRRLIQGAAQCDDRNGWSSSWPNS